MTIKHQTSLIAAFIAGNMTVLPGDWCYCMLPMMMMMMVRN